MREEEILSLKWRNVELDRERIILEKAKLVDFRFHDLRHTAASYLAMNGASLVEITGVLGHRDFSTVRRYAHLSESHVASTVKKMNQRFIKGAERSSIFSLLAHYVKSDQETSERAALE